MLAPYFFSCYSFFNSINHSYKEVPPSNGLNLNAE
jgi:hypothetical protein